MVRDHGRAHVVRDHRRARSSVELRPNVLWASARIGTHRRMTSLATWDDLPTKGELKGRIDAFLRAFRDGDLTTAFGQCPPMTFVKGEGLKVRTDLTRAALAEHL